MENCIKDLYWKYRKLIFQRKVSQICKFAAQILKEHKKGMMMAFEMVKGMMAVANENLT